MVGHLGREQLAALGVSAVVLTTLFAIFNFLQYGTTAQVGRASGAGQEEAARRLGAQTLWLCLAVGVVLAAGVAAFAPQIVRAMGSEGDAADYAVTYLQIVALGLPSVFVTIGSQGYLRGVADLRTPVVILAAGNAINIVLNLVFVYGLDWGIAGSAAATVVGQTAMGAAFVVALLRSAGHDLRPRPDLMRRLVSVGRFIFVRTVALMAAFLLAGAIVTRSGDASIGAHQIAFQLWLFLALVLDAIAIAGQVLVGRGLGAGDTQRAYDASARMIWLAVYVGGFFAVALLLLEGVLPRVFTSDELVLDQAGAIWLLFALMQPLNGAVFALDGILIGAGDGPYLAWSMVAAFVASAAVALASVAFDWGIVGVWSALVVLILVRLALMWHRFASRRWLVTGWT